MAKVTTPILLQPFIGKNIVITTRCIDGDASNGGTITAIEATGTKVLRVWYSTGAGEGYTLLGFHQFTEILAKGFNVSGIVTYSIY